MSDKVAVISGGSSGIGLACARVLARQGYRVILLARDISRLEAACAALEPVAPAGVEHHVLNVDDEVACRQLIARIAALHFRIDWLITSAGMVEPAMFFDSDIESHERQMRTNYFGTLFLVKPCAELMRRQGGGRITLISSAAAFVGIAGYSGYAPGKFAVRALGEVLRVEGAAYGIEVSVAFPPDTDTPQLAYENLKKPSVTRAISESGGVWSADVVATRIIARAQAGAFMLTPSWLLAAFGFTHSLYAPLFRRRQIRLLRGRKN